jgi:hypothetical protein
MTPPIAPPRGAREHEDVLTTRRALLRLFHDHPNELVTRAMIHEEMGHEVSDQAVWLVVRSLRRDWTIESVTGPGGGYVSLQPILTLGRKRCCTCSHRTSLSTCAHVRVPLGLDGERRPVEALPNRGCWGWDHV